MSKRVAKPLALIVGRLGPASNLRPAGAFRSKKLGLPRGERNRRALRDAE